MASSKVSDLRIMVFGTSAEDLFTFLNSILKRDVLSSAGPNTVLTTKLSGHILDRNVMLISTSNLNHHSLSHDSLKRELKKSVCFSCPGPHVILFTLCPFDLLSDPWDFFQPVVQFFGENILNHTIVVLYQNGEAKIQIDIENIRELINKCGQRYLDFNIKENREDSKETRQLFGQIDQLVSEQGYYSNKEFEDADKRIKKEEKFLEKQRETEVRRMLEALKKEHSGEDLEREVRIYQEKISLENREKAELLIADRLGFTLRLVDYAAAIGKEVFVGGILGTVMGPEGMAVGATVGAALGGVYGGAAGAAWNYIRGAFADAHSDFP
ncbi:GTPase IMAP family member 7 [Hoplias malabaricus]|uniref:GTPase IMAP family member 7 n=1 Tax=Hoplias malabaricus TaxID=27720 RepID=UPI003461CDA0